MTYFPMFNFQNTFFLVKFGPEISKCFVLNETWCMDVFKGADSEFDNCFFTGPISGLRQFLTTESPLKMM